MAFFDEYDEYLGDYFNEDQIKNVLDGLASKEWVERLIAGLSISGITPEEFERIMGKYVLEKNFATINGSKITNKEVFALVEQGEYDEQIQQILQAISAATPSDYDAVKTQVSANTENITNLSASTQEEIQNIYQTISGISPEGYESLQEQVSANTEDIAELKTAVSGINETIAEQNSAITGINEALVVLSAQTSANTAQIADLSGFTNESVSSLTNDIEVLSEVISGLTPEGYEALQQQVSANTEDIAELSGLTADLSGLTTDLSGLTTDLSGVTSGLSSDLQALSSYTGNISELVSANTNSITNLNGQVTGLTSDLAVLSAFTETLTADTSNIAFFNLLKDYGTSWDEVARLYDDMDAANTAGKSVVLISAFKDSSQDICVFALCTKDTLNTNYYGYGGGGFYQGSSYKVARAIPIFRRNDYWNVTAKNGHFYFNSSDSFGSYNLPTASASTKGGIKVGTGLSMSGEVMNADVASNDVHNIVSLTQSAYDALTTKDANTLYIIKPLY